MGGFCFGNVIANDPSERSVANNVTEASRPQQAKPKQKTLAGGGGK
jgi:hypothetical protein